MNNLLWKIYASSKTDIAWLQTLDIPSRWSYLVKKYLFLLFSPLYWNNKSNSYTVSVFNQTLHIPTVEHIAFVQGTYIDHAYLQNYIPQDATVIDVGAHIGEFALVCKTCLHTKKVFSFEPIRKTYNLLQLNTSFTAYHAAIGLQKEQQIYVGTNTVTASAFAALKQDVPELSPCISLDTLPEIAALTNIDLFKIDVEGMEYDVLLASKETLKKSTYILIELSLHRPATEQAMETLTLLQEIIPNIELIHMGTIFTSKISSKQVAFDALFYNKSAKST